MPERMQSRIRDRVGGMKGGKAQPVQFPALAPVPKLVQALRRETFGLLVPKSEVQFQRQRDVRIVEIVAPLPAGLANQSGQVIDGMPVERHDGLITEVQRNIAGTQ